MRQAGAMNQHPKIEALEHQRDMLASAVRGLEDKEQEARAELQRAQVFAEECTQNRLATDAQRQRANADRDRAAQRLEVIRNRRKTMDADRTSCALVAERLARWWRDNGEAA